MPKVAEPPAAVPVVPDEDPAIAEIIRRAKALAARKAKEAADHLRAITGRHTPHGTDHEPRGGYTGQPRPRPGRFFDLDVRLGD